jgi:multidrug efflux pump
MTSLCSAFGALPLLLAHGAGAETRQPIGIVVLYGVGISLVLTLFVVPAVYRLVARGTRSPEHWLRIIHALRGERPAPAAGEPLPAAPGATAPGAASPSAAHAPHD